mgnify:CR=1 FL=1|tara:strand:- start:18 stop:368 length:351 start_codon:yes stop_codon:yes gene_type:complete
MVPRINEWFKHAGPRVLLRRSFRPQRIYENENTETRECEECERRINPKNGYLHIHKQTRYLPHLPIYCSDRCAVATFGRNPGQGILGHLTGAEEGWQSPAIFVDEEGQAILPQRIN